MLLDILPSKYYRHWSLLVGALNYLSLFEYEKDELVSIDKILKEFVNQTSTLYSKETIKINRKIASQFLPISNGGIQVDNFQSNKKKEPLIKLKNLSHLEPSLFK